MKRILSALAVSGACLAGVALYPATNPATEANVASQEGTVYKIDTLHSGVFFQIRHMGVTNFVGSFDKFDGSFNIDWESPENSFMEIEVDAASVDSNNEKRDGHIKSNDFFTVKQFPKITFTGKTFKKTSDETMEIMGDLTFLGMTKPVTVETTLVGVGNTRQGYKMGIDSTFTIKRTDFGNSTYVEEGALGDEVTLWVNLAGVRQDG